MKGVATDKLYVSKWRYSQELLIWYSEVAPMSKGSGPMSIKNMKEYLSYALNHDRSNLGK